MSFIIAVVNLCIATMLYESVPDVKEVEPAKVIEEKEMTIQESIEIDSDH